jgi:large subunit ribosomal protein L21
VIEVELMHGQHGTAITFTPLLVVDDEGKTHFGKDLGRAQVKAKLLGEEKGEKVKIFKYRPKSGYARRAGHRQMLTVLEIEDVSLGVPTKKAAPKKAEKSEDEAAPASEPKAATPEPKAATPEPEAMTPEPEIAD